MPNSTATPFSNAPDREVWQNLKNAIASSSGFQRWMLERQIENASISKNPSKDIDELVRSYLRETLETLAY